MTSTDICHSRQRAFEACRSFFVSDFEFTFHLASSWHALDPVTVPHEPKSLAADPRFANGDAERCRSLQSMVSQGYGRSVAPARCAFRRVGGHVANAIEVEGPIAGTRNLEGRVQASGDSAISILGTFWSGHLEAVRTEFDEILISIRFEQDPFVLAHSYRRTVEFGFSTREDRTDSTAGRPPRGIGGCPVGPHDFGAIPSRGPHPQGDPTRHLAGVL
jgi:hypothetical protein